MLQIQNTGVKTQTPLTEFQNCFPKVLKNMKFLETFVFNPCSFRFIESQHIAQYVLENYGPHCLSASLLWRNKFNELLSHAPFKILTYINESDLTEQNFSVHYCASHLEYIHLNFDNLEQITCWDKYREIFDQCTNLKAIAFEKNWGSKRERNFITDKLPNLSETKQNIWKERISYFEARGIDIVHPKEITNNESLRVKVAKEAGVPWIFHFGK